MGLYAFSEPVGVLEHESDNQPIFEQLSNLCTEKTHFCRLITDLKKLAFDWMAH